MHDRKPGKRIHLVFRMMKKNNNKAGDSRGMLPAAWSYQPHSSLRGAAQLASRSKRLFCFLLLLHSGRRRRRAVEPMTARHATAHSKLSVIVHTSCGRSEKQYKSWALSHISVNTHQSRQYPVRQRGGLAQLLPSVFRNHRRDLRRYGLGNCQISPK